MGRSRKEMQLFWRPDFVNKSELPDIKVIRTGFIINLIAVISALCVAFILLQREYRVYTLGQTVEALEQQIRVTGADDLSYLKLSESFRSAAQKVIELDKFYDSPLSAHHLLYGLSTIKPGGLIFNSVSFNESVVKAGGKERVAYSINISGNAKILTLLDDFKKALAEAALLKIVGFELEIDEILQGRDEKTGNFPYRLAISLTPTQKAPANKSEGRDAP